VNAEGYFIATGSVQRRLRCLGVASPARRATAKVTMSLFRLDTGRLDHLPPLLCVVDDEVAELDGRVREWFHPQIGEARLEIGINEGRIDFLVERIDDFRG
jgi:hypothetical protein